MKKRIAVLSAMFALMLNSVFASAPVTSVKIGKLVEGKKLEITFDKSKLMKALTVLCKDENAFVDDVALFCEEGNYYIWAGMSLVNDKNYALGKMIFSVELDAENNIVLSSRPIYLWRCLSVNSSCTQCKIMGTSCFCQVSPSPTPGQCYWQKTWIGDDGRGDKVINPLGDVIDLLKNNEK